MSEAKNKIFLTNLKAKNQTYIHTHISTYISLYADVEIYKD